jgi:glycolate oxidase iron-sulfur subunit
MKDDQQPGSTSGVAPSARDAAARRLLEEARPGMDLCVHCGFCLQACPTYLALEDENDSPRGRIVLMRALADAALPLDDADAGLHLDRCLGCRACETACPSGVPYGSLLEAARASLREVRRPDWFVRALLGVFATPWALRAAMAVSRFIRFTRVPALLGRLPGRFAFANAMLESTRDTLARNAYRAPGGTTGRRGSVAVLRGCVMEGLFASTNRATERTLAANEYAVVDAPGQRCCGALHAHAGDLEGARRLARVNIAAFERSGAAHVAVNSAGCGAMMKEYGHLLKDDSRWASRAHRFATTVRDATELLAVAGPRRGGALPVTVAYDAPCHLLHAQRVSSPPLAVLGAIPGLQLAPLEDADQCCGAAGLYSLVEPATSQAVLTPKLRNLEATRARWVATGNPGCLMQLGAGLLRAGTPMRAIHPVALLDASYAALAGGGDGSLPTAE